jgi:voltage-gated potassium channel
LSDLSNLMAKIPQPYQPQASVAIGSLILVLIVLYHGACLHRILVLYKRGERRLRIGKPHLLAALLLFAWSIFLMLALHISEIAIWAACLKGLGLIKHADDAVYFCANSYSTLGFGNVDLLERWRNISPIIGISGLFTFAWTTSAAVDVVDAQSKLIERLEEEREHEMHMRFAMRKELWNVLKKEKAAQRAEREKTRTEASGIPFFQRHKLWKEERKREKDLRQARATAIAELRGKEKLEEKKLGTAELPQNSDSNKDSNKKDG